MRRDELYNDNSEGEAESYSIVEDAGIREKLSERLSRMISLDLAPQMEVQPEPMQEDEPELEFRLFSTSAPKVVVRDDDETGGEGGIISARPAEFYLKDFTPEEREGFRQVAVDYADIIREARQRAWGLEVPWRVSKITVKAGRPTSFTVSQQKKPQSKSKSKQKPAQEEEPGKRKRPGKKRRIILRTKEKERLEKERIRKEKEEAMEKQRMTKEEHLKEKKKRLNREKKLKRRQKEKEKKMATKGENDGGDEAHGGGDGEGSGSDTDGSQ